MSNTHNGDLSDLSDFEDDVGSSPAPSSNADDSKRHARAQHNALERRRRDNIKDMYNCLRDSVPEMNRERASRAQILKRAIEVIEDKEQAQRNISSELQQIEEENRRLEAEIRQLQEENKNSDRLAPV